MSDSSMSVVEIGDFLQADSNCIVSQVFNSEIWEMQSEVKKSNQEQGR